MPKIIKLYSIVILIKMANAQEKPQAIPMKENWDNKPTKYSSHCLSVESAADDDFFYKTIGMDMEDEAYNYLYVKHLSRRLSRLRARLVVVRAQRGY